MKVTLTDKQITIWDYDWVVLRQLANIANYEKVSWEELLLCAEAQIRGEK